MGSAPGPPQAPSPVSALVAPSRVLSSEFGQNIPSSPARPLSPPRPQGRLSTWLPSARVPARSHHAGLSPPGDVPSASPSPGSSAVNLRVSSVLCSDLGPASCPQRGVPPGVSAVGSSRCHTRHPSAQGSKSEGPHPLRGFCSEGGGRTRATAWTCLGNSGCVEVRGHRG